MELLKCYGGGGGGGGGGGSDCSDDGGNQSLGTRYMVNN